MSTECFSTAIGGSNPTNAKKGIFPFFFVLGAALLLASCGTEYNVLQIPRDNNTANESYSSNSIERAYYDTESPCDYYSALCEDVACDCSIIPHNQYPVDNETKVDLNGSAQINIAHFLFGDWLLEEIVLRQTTFEDGDMPLVLLPVCVEGYAGYIMRFSADYVRLGNRVMTEPIYSYWITSADSHHQCFFLSYYMRLLIEQGLEVKFDGASYPVIVINISYPEYPLVTHRGYEIDPFLFPYGDYEFHPLFQSITLLNDGLILVGNRERFLARRME